MLNQANHKKGSLAVILLTIFIDLLGLGIIIPIFTPLFLDMTNGVLPASYTLANRAILLGLLIATFPLAQFFGAPILGALADRYGRKRLLLFSLFGTLVGYLIFVTGILTRNLPLLFAGRLLDGFTGGNMSIAMSSIADMSTEEEKAKHFGYAGVAVGLGLILGPVIGGSLGDHSISHWFNYATPFLFTTILAALNLAFVTWLFRETIHHRIQAKVSLLTGFYNLRRAFQLSNLRILFSVTFFLAFGFNFFVQFFQVFLIQKFHFSESSIGIFFAYGGLWIAISQGILTPFLTCRYSIARIIRFAILFLALAYPILLLPNKVITLYAILPFLAVFYGLTQPTLAALISNLTDEDSQGEILGINQSIQSLAQAVPPIIAGIIVAISAELPIVVAAIATLVAWFIYIVLFTARPEKKFIEV